MLKEELDFAINLAKKAGNLIMTHVHDKVAINYKKNEYDPVTTADLEADALIISEIKKEYLKDGILTEESKDNSERLKKERVWIIDPIDGTANFKEYALSNGNNKDYQYFAVHIGLAINKEAVLGVIYAPVVDELYYAVKGQGAYKIIKDNKEKLPTNKEERKELSISIREELIKTEAIQKLPDFPKKELRPYKRVFGYTITAIADNKLDGYLSNYPGFGEWDLCAPQVILEEAGGIMTHLDGSKITYNNKSPYSTPSVFAIRKPGLIPFLKE